MHSGTDFNSGSKFTNVEGAGRFQNRFREHKKIIFGEHQENNSGSREKRVKFQKEPGAGDPPYGVSLV